MPKGQWILTLPARRQRCQDCAHAAVPNPQTTERLCTSFAAYSVCRQVLAKLTCAVVRKAKAAPRRRCDSCMANRSGSTSTRAREPAPHAGPCTTSPRTPILILNGAASVADAPNAPDSCYWFTDNRGSRLAAKELRRCTQAIMALPQFQLEARSSRTLRRHPPPRLPAQPCLFAPAPSTTTRNCARN